MYNKENVTELAKKYLDRVELKGLMEFHEFSYLLNFFAELEKGTLEIKTKEE